MSVRKSKTESRMFGLCPKTSSYGVNQVMVWTLLFYVNIAVKTNLCQLVWFSSTYDFKYSFRVEWLVSRTPCVGGWWGEDEKNVES